ncbi:MAG: apolipoprotein N-acyltransferase [Candidatus Omnitrophica bacterium]|nr:apolipoprotein N-acyltransferase [Candidatus Omnitrophota bacterium]MCM8791002.1 apolipoprotein N-acyltransferase [Candidatus Omnitrophota bacterium]
MKEKPQIVKADFFLSTLAAFCLILSFPSFNLWFFAWIGFIPLFLAIDGKSLLKAFFISYLTGVLFFFGIAYWLVHVTLPGMVIVVIYLGLYFGIFGFAASRASDSHPMAALIVAPSVWVALEWVRSHMFGGFGWALLAHSQSSNLPVIQIADVTGAYGVSFLVMMINYAVFLTAREIRRKNNYTYYLAIALLVLFISLAYGGLRLKNIFAGELLRVAVVQGNIPQDKKWDENFREEILDIYRSLTLEASNQHPDLIVWPETSVPGYLELERDLWESVSGLVKDVNKPILVGTPSVSRSAKDVYYNSAVLFREDGTIVERYDKLHLVPFGEYVPLKNVFWFVEKFAARPIGDFSAGKNWTVFNFFIERKAKTEQAHWKLLKKVKFSCLICFEDIFPDMAREFVKRGAAFLVNITNDAWFGRTAAAYQHAQTSVFRAVENRVNVVRAANTGISCFIDQKGAVVAEVSSGGSNLFVRGIKTHDIVMANTRTIYTKYGDIFAYLCICVTLIYCVGLIFKGGAK